MIEFENVEVGDSVEMWNYKGCRGYFPVEMVSEQFFWVDGIRLRKSDGEEAHENHLDYESNWNAAR